MQFVGGGLGLDVFRKWKHGVARAKCRACDVATQPRVPTDALRAKGRILSPENRTIPGSAQLRAAMRNRSIWIAIIIRVVATGEQTPECHAGVTNRDQKEKVNSSNVYRRFL